MKRSLFIFVILACCAVSSRDLHACSCRESPAPKIAVTNSTVVFAGRVTAVQAAPGAQNVFRFEIIELVKGSATKVIHVSSTVANGGSCGFGFEVGKEYLVYTHGAVDALTTSSCTRTTLLDEKGKLELKEIRVMPTAG